MYQLTESKFNIAFSFLKGPYRKKTFSRQYGPVCSETRVSSPRFITAILDLGSHATVTIKTTQRKNYTVEILVSGHPRNAKKVSVTTGDGRLRECKNTEFVWELGK